VAGRDRSVQRLEIPDQRRRRLVDADNYETGAPGGNRPLDSSDRPSDDEHAIDLAPFEESASRGLRGLKLAAGAVCAGDRPRRTVPPGAAGAKGGRAGGGQGNLEGGLPMGDGSHEVDDAPGLEADQIGGVVGDECHACRRRDGRVQRRAGHGERARESERLPAEQHVLDDPRGIDCGRAVEG
jgi:hypothetical protein